MATYYVEDTAKDQLNRWFIEQGYTTEINNNRLKVIGLDWHQYAFRGDIDPLDGLLEPYDEQTMIFVKL